jgi:hypothetical protein
MILLFLSHTYFVIEESLSESGNFFKILKKPVNQVEIIFHLVYSNGNIKKQKISFISTY